MPLRKSLLQYLDELIDEHGPYFEDGKLSMGFGSRSHKMGEIFHETTAVFVAAGIGSNYLTLVDAHLSLGIESANEAYKTKNTAVLDDKTRSIRGVSLFRCKMAEIHVERRERIVKHLRSHDEWYTQRLGTGLLDHLGAAEIESLWWVLILRSICWWLSIDVVVTTSSIPSHYYNSQMPVYIT